MELQQLKYFRVAAELQHVTRAAEKLFVSQSAISRAVTQLEEELGVKLFNRQGRAIVLTRYGQLFLDHVIRVQNAIDSARQALSEESGKETGTISLGFLPSLGVELVPRLIKEYRRKFPRIQFTLIQQAAASLMEQLNNGNVDLCFSVPSMFDPPRIRWTRLLDEEIVIVLPQAHRLALRRSLRLKDLAQETFLSLNPGSTLKAIFDKACADAKFVPKIGFEGTDFGTLRGMIAAGLGIGMLPRSPVHVPGTREIELSQPHIVRPLGIGWIEERYLAPCAAAFRDFVNSRRPDKSR
jgi:LysR family transcriptional regulator, transcription activator of glutamate synthase operon